MLPDDRRHGSYAGVSAHRKAGETICPSCLAARRRHDKRIRVYGSPKRMGPLGEAAYDILVRTPRSELERSGVLSTQVTRLRRNGPEARVAASTRQRILAAGGAHITITGARRRLQALAALGWSSAEVAQRSGVHHCTLSDIRSGKRGHYLHRDVAAAIGRVYDELSMTIPPDGKSASWTRTKAKQAGYRPPLFWDDDRIDDPDHGPRMPKERSRRRTDVDEAVVVRILGGELLEATPAEKAEVIARWVTAGGSERGICDRLGWRHNRYRRASTGDREAS